jgi:rubrerythrin
VNINHILLDETETAVQQLKDRFPNPQVVDFILEVCQQERQHLEMMKRWSEEKAVFKVPKPLELKY